MDATPLLQEILQDLQLLSLISLFILKWIQAGWLGYYIFLGKSGAYRHNSMCDICIYICVCLWWIVQLLSFDKISWEVPWFFQWILSLCTPNFGLPGDHKYIFENPLSMPIWVFLQAEFISQSVMQTYHKVRSIEKKKNILNILNTPRRTMV